MADPRTHRRHCDALVRDLYGCDFGVTHWQENGAWIAVVMSQTDVPIGNGMTAHEALRDLEWRLEALARGEPEPVGHVGDFEAGEQPIAESDRAR